MFFSGMLAGAAGLLTYFGQYGPAVLIGLGAIVVALDNAADRIVKAIQGR